MCFTPKDTKKKPIFTWLKIFSEGDLKIIKLILEVIKFSLLKV
jgi:hypothetical protein